MNKGFSLIEVIVYISLLSVLMIGIFSSLLGYVYGQMKRDTFKTENYQLLIKSFYE